MGIKEVSIEFPINTRLVFKDDTESSPLRWVKGYRYKATGIHILIIDSDESEYEYTTEELRGLLKKNT